ncbi:MAG: hypothetical protein D3922_10290, partial [Candidatus Electrothrix sp. AR1]|nr:hypothetical protein [Candidatus Electrothrix sp. AR1]
RQGLAGRVNIMQQELQEIAASEQRASGSLFDGILIDAPCTGTGVIRKHPDIRWNRQPEDFVASQEQQLALLRVAAALVKPGGVLVYATCSLELEENQEVIEQFLSSFDAFALTDCGISCLKPLLLLLMQRAFLRRCLQRKLKDFLRLGWCVD